MFDFEYGLIFPTAGPGAVFLSAGSFRVIGRFSGRLQVGFKLPVFGA